MPGETPQVFPVGGTVVLKRMPPGLNPAYAAYLFKGITGVVEKVVYSTAHGQRLYTLNIPQTGGGLITVPQIPENCLGSA
ncbi:hypothetical protein D9619_005335 [Psilocybe cf. subviscida]|uniref:Uncharacterized protein n=1 Tax=Psilocybe cf. subviscida TaxID=2480587 RepID=A0A8H5BXP9_9AGAR|nr:hypothetical protein D9619_005335 [Psilocybe cf. subviscida]